MLYACPEGGTASIHGWNSFGGVNAGEVNSWSTGVWHMQVDRFAFNGGAMIGRLAAELKLQCGSG